MPSPAQITVEFGGADARVSEGLGETYWLAAVSDLQTALAIGINYANWRREWLSQGLFIVAVRASLVTVPPVSDSSRLLLEGTLALSSGASTRDVLSSGLLFRCKDASGASRGNRFYRGFPDGVIDYTAAGQEVEYPIVTQFRDALLTKTVALGLGLKSMSRDPGITFPKPLNPLTIVDGVLTGFTAVGAGAQPEYAVGEKITVTGAKGTRSSIVNGVYTILTKTGDVLTVTPNKTIPQGFTYINGSAKANLRVPAYPVIAQAQYQRFGTREVGGAPFQRRSRRRRVS